jgi:tRNA pseudouridine13 synthase
MISDYQIKQAPEEFLVREIISEKRQKLPDEGEFLIFLLRKKDYNTETAVQRIADALRIQRKNIGYAGSKDRQAVSEQFISIRGSSREKIESINLKDITLKFIGFSREKISLGELEGNEFEIVVRNITGAPKQTLWIVNYFGEQRFSTNNAEVGKAIIKKDFRKAIDILLEHTGKEEEKMRAYLAAHKNDYVGALKTMPWKNLTMYVHACQSKIWNEAAKRLVEGSPTAASGIATLPIVGFASELKDDVAGNMIRKVMEEEGVAQEDFIIRAIPELSIGGDERKLYTEIKGLSIGELEDDELNPGKKKVLVKFGLGKGSYATEVIKVLFQPKSQSL